METKTNKLDDNKLEITVDLTAEEVQKEIDAAYKEANKTRIPGFRPGKAPRKVLENAYGGKEYFAAQATDALINAYTPEAMNEADAVALGQTNFAELDTVTEGEPYTFTFSMEVAPELKLSSYDPVQIELPSDEVTDEEIQVQIDALLSYNSAFDEEGNQEKPELTDAWVKETFEFESVDEFKERIEESIRFQKAQEIPTIKEFRCSQALAERLEGEVPDSLVAQTEQENYRELFQNLQRSRQTLDQYLAAYGYTPETLRENMKTQAADSAKVGLALDAMAREQGMIVTDEELLQEFTSSGLANPEAIYNEWSRNGRLPEVRQGILRMKSLEYVKENAEIFGIGELYPVEEEIEEATEAEEAPAEDIAATTDAAEEAADEAVDTAEATEEDSE